MFAHYAMKSSHHKYMRKPRFLENGNLFLLLVGHAVLSLVERPLTIASSILEG